MTDQTALSYDDKIAFLSQLEIFEELDDGELDDLAKICQQYAFVEGAVVVHQREVADKLYIVESGRLEAVSINEEGVSRRVTQYLPDSCFDDVWLFNPSTHPCSIQAKRNGRLFIIKSGDFLAFLNRHKNVLNRLLLSEEALEELEKSPLAKPDRRYRKLKLVPGELIELETRRSRWVLVAKLIFPLLGLTILPALIYFSLTGSFPDLGLVWIVSFTGLLAFIFFIVVIFQWLDWTNDHLIITNKRLVHYEFDLRSLSGKGKDTLMDQVQSVEIVIPNIYSKILNLGTARVTTSAQSVLFFDYLNSPERVKHAINSIGERRRSMNSGEFKATMRRSVESYFKVKDPLVSLKEEAPPRNDAMPGLFTRLLLGIRGFKLYKYRQESGGTITYRKHLFALLVDLVWPSGVALALGIMLIGLRFFDLGEFAGFVIVAGLIDVLWFIWRTEDWRNDTFQVTERYVIDIDRRPFGFGESRKQAQLDNIQNVEADRPNFIATIFNFGNVEVDTAGADSNIVFENVSNPEAVKNDIFKKRTSFENQKRKNQAERQRQEYAVLLDVFMQEQELDRVKRRTPDFDSFAEFVESNSKNQSE